MHVVTGALGQTGSAVCDALLKAGRPVRLVVRRDDERAAAWRARGAEIALADLSDTAALTRAFEGAQGAYLMNPPAYMEDDMFAQARRVHASLVVAANQARVPHVVALSSVGAHQPAGTGNILTTHDFEQQLRDYRGALTVLRAANFIENWAWSLEPVKAQGVLPSMFLPLERALPMVAAADIGHAAARLLQDAPASRRIVELHGPRDYSPLDAARVFGESLGRPVQAVAVPEAEWAGVFRGQGFPDITVRAFCDMFNGFNDGTVSFEGTHDTWRGETSLDDVLAGLASTGDQ